MTSSCPKRRRAKRTPSSILVRTFCLRRCAAISATSPNQDGVEGTDSAEVWMITDPSAILVICTSLRESVLFFLLKEAHFMLARSFLAARCAIRGSRLHCLVGWRISTCTCAPLARGEKPSGSTQASEYRRLRLSQPAVRVLRHHRRFHSCAGWRWQTWPGREDPDLSLSGLPHHLHFQALHAFLSSENPFPADRNRALCPG